jgi:hypothetical protein
VAQKHLPTIKSLEQLVAEYPHVQFFRDMLGMRQDAIRERDAQGEKHWHSLGVRLQISLSASHRPPHP